MTSPGFAVGSLARRVVTEAVRMSLARSINGGRVIVVNGLRRSGNHAVIEWIGRGVTGGTAGFRQLDELGFVRVMDDGRVIHLNDVGRLPVLDFLRVWTTHLRWIWTADVLIISFEDCESSSVRRSIKVPSKGHLTFVHVHRTLPNVVASRLKRLQTSAMEGRAEPLMEVSRRLLDVHRENLEHGDPWIHVRFDDWLQDRTTAMAGLGLEHDILGSISVVGRGSSFQGTQSAAPNDLSRRHELVPIGERLGDLLLESGLLSDSEGRAIRRQISTTERPGVAKES